MANDTSTLFDPNVIKEMEVLVFSAAFAVDDGTRRDLSHQLGKRIDRMLPRLSPAAAWALQRLRPGREAMGCNHPRLVTSWNTFALAATDGW